MCVHTQAQFKVNLNTIKINHIIKNKIINKDMKDKCCQGCRGKGPLFHTVCGYEFSCYSKHYGGSQKIPYIYISFDSTYLKKIKLEC